MGRRRTLQDQYQQARGPVRTYGGYDPRGFRQATPYPYSSAGPVAGQSLPVGQGAPVRMMYGAAGPLATGPNQRLGGYRAPAVGQGPVLPVQPGIGTPEERARLLAMSAQPFPGGPTVRAYTDAPEAASEGGLLGIGQYGVQNLARTADAGNRMLGKYMYGPDYEPPWSAYQIALGVPAIGAGGELIDTGAVGPIGPPGVDVAAAVGAGPALGDPQLPYGPFPGTGEIGQQPAYAEQQVGPQPAAQAGAGGTGPTQMQQQAPTQYKPMPDFMDQGEQKWWNAFQDEHEGRTPVEAYRWESRSDSEALKLALNDRRWSQGFAREKGRPPTREEWENNWYNTRAYGRP